MQTIEMNAKKRTVSTRSVLNSLRKVGEVPAVVYGGRKEPWPMSVNGKEFLQIVRAHGINVVMNLKVGNETETVLVKEIQRDPLGHHILHIDFQRISLTEKIEVGVPVRVKGEAPGVKLSGGILEHILREVRVKCLPMAIPQALDIDVSSLQINQSLKVKDVARPEGMEILTEADQIVVNIVAPSELEEVTPAAAVPTGPAEPEVIAKGKKPEEGEEGAAAAPAAAKDAKAPPAKEAKPPAKEGK